MNDETISASKPDPVRAICLFSGGLDSQLAVCVLREQGIEARGVVFRSEFFDQRPSIRAAKALELPLETLDFNADILELLRAPRHGFGSGMNPCIDCHARMIRRAGEWMDANGFHLIATGEVAGERPMSQGKGTLQVVARESGYGDRLLRPLSALLLPATVPEQQGWVDRNRLLAIEGRSRKPQMELVKKYGLKEHPQPAGGCLLTDPTYSLKLRDLAQHEGLDPRWIARMRMGRQFRALGARLVIGRNHAENTKLESAAGPGDLLLRAVDYMGPTGLMASGASDEQLRLAGALLARYTDAPAGDTIRVSVEGGQGRTFEAQAMTPENVDGYRV